MRASIYLDAFNTTTQEFKDKVHLTGDYLLVEVPPIEEKKTASGLIIDMGTESTANIMGMDENRLLLCYVVAVGAGYYDDDTGADVPLDATPGDIIAISNASLRRYSVFGDMKDYQPRDLGLTRMSDIQMHFKGGKETVESFFTSLNSSNIKEKRDKR